MARSASEEEIKLRKRARRRLIGAIALTTLVVVALPMVLDSEPRPIGDDIAVQIPSPGAGPFAPATANSEPGKGRPADASKGTVTPTAPAKGVTPDAVTFDPAVNARPAGTSVAPKAPAAPAQANGTIPSAVAPGDMKVAGSDATSPLPQRSATSAGAASSSAAVSTPTPANAAADARANDKANEKGVENFVIQLGAFAEVDRARSRQAQLVKAGIKSYTEVIKTPTGDKTRVRAGPYPTRDAAEKANEQLKALGIADGVVVTRRY
ncbi:MAG: SPOR domain-containing protein [Proteobacteria bacterium]|nr:SPOR domain-containing protein [Burkholderiales bacterium]